MVGPKVNEEKLTIDFPTIPTQTNELEAYLELREDTVKGLKPGNEAYIQWADSTLKTKTPYSIVYIHGFGAGSMEGDPVHRFLGEHFGVNVFVTRLPEHGIRRPDGMAYLTAKSLANAAGEAYQIGKSIGDSVIVVGTSMGGALSLLLASQQPDIKALVLYSPAIRDAAGRLESFFKPWTKLIMEKTMTENGAMDMKRTGEKGQFWSEVQHVNAYESLAVLMYCNMNQETFQKVTQPVFMGYYYKNQQEQDFVVSVPKMLEMYSQLGTPSSLKKEMAFPKTGDHVIASSITSQDWQTVLFETIAFLENIAKVPPREAYSERVKEIKEANDLTK